MSKHRFTVDIPFTGFVSVEVEVEEGDNIAVETPADLHKQLSALRIA